MRISVQPNKQSINKYIVLDKVLHRKDWWTIWYFLCTGKFVQTLGKKEIH